MKIFLTVGSMLPFDRLVLAMDDWARLNPSAEVFSQIGQGGTAPSHMEHVAMVGPAAYRKHFAAADLVVSHVGMGTVITAAELGKPLVLLARKPELQEVTSNHQVATASWLCQRPGVLIAQTVSDIPDLIAKSVITAGVSNIGTDSRKELLEAIRNFIAN